MARDAHGAGLAVVTREAARGDRLNPGVVWLFGRPVDVGVLPQVRLSIVGLRVLALPRRDLVGVDVHLSILHPGLERLEDLRVVVRADARLDPIVPPVESAHEVVTAHEPVAEQRPAVQTPTKQDRDLVIPPDDHEVDVRDEGVGGGAVLEIAPLRDDCGVHTLSMKGVLDLMYDPKPFQGATKQTEERASNMSMRCLGGIATWSWTPYFHIAASFTSMESKTPPPRSFEHCH